MADYYSDTEDYDTEMDCSCDSDECCSDCEDLYTDYSSSDDSDSEMSSDDSDDDVNS